MLRKKRRLLATGYLTAFGALLVAQAPNARADSASCLTKASSFVTELDELLLKEKNWSTPYFDLIDRYFPLRDCEADALLDVVRGSRFIRSISYHARTNQFYCFLKWRCRCPVRLPGFGEKVAGGFRRIYP
jgi:hypothetical protein